MKNIENQYTFDINDVGCRSIVATYNDLAVKVDISVIGPNLRSTEKDNSHLYFKTSDGKYLNIGE